MFVKVIKGMNARKDLDDLLPGEGEGVDGEEGTVLEDGDAPISMVWEKPSPGSIWHNQQG